MKNFLSIALAVVILGACIIFLTRAGKGTKEPKHNTAKVPDRYVKAAKINYQDQDATISGTGRLNSYAQIDVSSQVSGKILAGDKLLKEGESFKKGDLLFRIFDEEAILKYQAEKSRFISNLAKILPNIRIDYPNLYPKWKVFLETIDLKDKLPELPEASDQKLQVYLSSQNILSSYYTLKADEIRLGYHKIRAPFSGTFATVYVQEGSIINTGSRVANLIQTDQFELSIPLSDDEIDYVHKGQEVTIKEDDNGNSWKGTIHRIAQFVDPSSQSVNIYVNVKQDANQPLYQGMYLNANIPNITIKECMRIPRRAVFNTNEVYTIVNGKLQKENINILNTGDEYIYFSGIDANKYIVVEPLVNATEGTPVKVLKQ